MRGLTVASGVAGVLVLARIGYTRSLIYDFLLWNLFLAWVPLLFALWFQKTKNLWGRRGLAIGWLAFYPNAAYIVTDIKHLRWALGAAWWFDVALLFVFAFLGMMVGLRSLRIFQTELAGLYGRAMSWVFVVVTALLAGVGIYIGRFLRWNSWDILRDPLGLVRDFSTQLATPEVWPRLIGVTLLYALLQLICYLSVIERR
jgi:uncharacterized membrane protein